MQEHYFTAYLEGTLTRLGVENFRGGGTESLVFSDRPRHPPKLAV